MANPDNQPRYRLLAQQCVDMLAGTSDPRARVSLLELARTWTRLADEHEALIAGGNVAAAPAGQQQQQIQPKDPQPDDH